MEPLEPPLDPPPFCQFDFDLKIFQKHILLIKGWCLKKLGFKAIVSVVCLVGMTKSCKRSLAIFFNWCEFMNYIYSNDCLPFCYLTPI